ncbi:MAG: prolyl oligopeptidase family serine peptidase [Proteobacteria bacterium]|nr:prolyl oligopeptidase family serine peptidase [Pseudomonadota bacterium]
MLASRIAALGFLAIGLACTGFGNHTVKDDNCGCALEVPFGYVDRGPDDDGIELWVERIGGDQYISVESWAKAERGDALSPLTALDRFTVGERWTGPGEEQPSPVGTESIDGWPALTRRTWTTMEHGTDITHWYALIDLPDRHVYLHAWGVATEPDRFDKAVELARGLTLTAPPRGQHWSSFSGTTPYVQSTTPPSIARGDLGADLRDDVDTPSTEPETPEGLERVELTGSAGPLVGWHTPPPSEGKHPVLLVVAFSKPSEYVDIGEEVNLSAYTDAGIPVFLATTRGRHGNAGRPDRYWDEVQDLLVAREHLAAQSWVDPDRIVLHGAYAGGTLALLAAAESPDFEKVIVLSSPVDLVDLHERYPAGYDPTEYNPSPDNHRLRSPIAFAEQLQSPVLYLWGERGFPKSGPFRMQRAAQQNGAPFELHTASEARVEDLSAGASALLAQRMVDGQLARPLTAEESLELELSVFAAAEARVRRQLADWLDARLKRGFEDRDSLAAATRDRAEDLLGARGPMLADAVFDAQIASWDAEMASWTQPTDNARLGSAFQRLADDGVHIEQNYEDCVDCAWAAMKHALIERNRRGSRSTGWIFFTEHDTQRAADHGMLWLNYGDYYGDDTPGLAKRIVAVLEEEGLKTTWDGDVGSRIGIEMQWRQALPAASGER